MSCTGVGFFVVPYYCYTDYLADSEIFHNREMNSLGLKDGSNVNLTLPVPLQRWMVSVWFCLLTLISPIVVLKISSVCLFHATIVVLCPNYKVVLCVISQYIYMQTVLVLFPAAWINNSIKLLFLFQSTCTRVQSICCWNVVVFITIGGDMHSFICGCVKLHQ